MSHDIEQSVSHSSRLLLWSILFVIIAFVVWANLAEIDTITRASGQVIVSSRNQVVQAPDGGVLEEMRVKEGDRVKRGQVLFRFEQERARAALQEAQAKVAALRATVARLKAEVYGGEPKFPDLMGHTEFRDNQMALFKRRQAAIDEEVSALQKSLDLVKAELEMNLPLLQSGDVSRAEVLKLQRQVAEIQGQITNRKNKYFQDAQAELTKAQEDLEATEQLLAQRKEQWEYTEVRAPMDGVVRNVRLTTRGGVAKPADEILQIVPVEDDLIIEAKVRPADIAFIKPGLPATVKLDAYDYSIYGSLEGTVSYISADTLNEETREGAQPYYRVQIKTSGRSLSSRRNERLDIQPGMTATVEIKTGSKTVWRYLTKPITKTMDESLGER
jgi:adhesin transport system membrane fusion protein